jgi:hypothetical protein
MTSSSASDHGNPAGIAALMQKGTTSKGMEANKSFAKWLSCGIQISGTFGLHHVRCSTLTFLYFMSLNDVLAAFNITTLDLLLSISFLFSFHMNLGEF